MKGGVMAGKKVINFCDLEDLPGIGPATAEKLSLSEDEQKLLVSSGTYEIDMIDISSINSPVSYAKKGLSGYSYSIKYDTNSSSFFYATDSNRFYRFKITY